MITSERIPAAFRDSKPTNLDERKSPAQRIHEALTKFNDAQVISGIYQLARGLEINTQAPHKPVIELYVPIRPDHTHVSIVLRDQLEPVLQQFGEHNAFVQGNGSYMWKSKGVKILDGQQMPLIVGYMRARTGYGEGNSEGGWVQLSESEKVGLTIHEQIKKAFELSTASHDDRIGIDVDQLTGRTENNAGFLTKRITFNPDQSIMLTDPPTK